MSFFSRTKDLLSRIGARLSRIAEAIRKVFVTVAVFGAIIGFGIGISFGLSQGRGKVEPKSVLVLAPEGELVEEKAGFLARDHIHFIGSALFLGQDSGLHMFAENPSVGRGLACGSVEGF